MQIGMLTMLLYGARGELPGGSYAIECSYLMSISASRNNGAMRHLTVNQSGPRYDDENAQAERPIIAAAA